MLLPTVQKKIIIRVLLITAMVIPTVQSAKATNYPYSLEGVTTAQLNGKKIVLSIRDNYNAKLLKKDTVIIQQGRFRFQGTLASPGELASLYLIGDKSGYANLLIEQGDAKMEIRALPPNWPLKKNILSNFTVFNSRGNELLHKTDSLATYYYEKFGTLEKKVFLTLTSEKQHSLWNEKLALVKEFGDSYVSLLILRNLLSERRSQIVVISETFGQLSEELQATEFGIKLKQEIKGKLARRKGQPVPAFNLNTAGGEITGSDKLNGKVYMLVFGATWCGPCKENYPAVRTLFDQYHSKGLEIISINLDDKKTLWLKQIEQYKMAWTNASELVTWEESRIVKDFGLEEIPLTLLVDKEGIIIETANQILQPATFERLKKGIEKALETPF